MAPGEQDKAADRRQGGALSREANTAMQRPPPAPGGTGLAGHLALSARSSDGTASTIARFLAIHPGQPPSRPCPICEAALRRYQARGVQRSEAHAERSAKRGAEPPSWMKGGGPAVGTAGPEGWEEKGFREVGG